MQGIYMQQAAFINCFLLIYAITANMYAVFLFTKGRISFHNFTKQNSVVF